MSRDPFQSVEKTVGSEALKIGQGLSNSIVGGVKQRVYDELSDTGFGKALRAVNLLSGAETAALSFGEASWGSENQRDWRVRLSLPANFSGSPLIAPLIETNGLVFPYTPTVIIDHAANYNAMTPVHSNYAYYAYTNSQVNAMQIVGEYLIENALEGEYWIGALHYLRSVTKMAYGDTSNQGSPPPVVKLNGYGDYVFKNVPVIVTMFTVELPNDVDYIQVGVGANGSWVPTRSQITVNVQPVYSRSKTSQFSLDAFVRGEYVIGGDGYM